MISTFNLVKLNALLKDFYKLTKIRITVFDEDFRELTSYPEQIAPVCQIIRSDEQAYLACRNSDERACETAKNRHKAFTYRCHAGLTESIAPLFMGNILIGYLLFGHVFSYSSHDEGWTAIRKCCTRYHIDLAALESACYEHPIIRDDYIDSASHILEAVSYYLCMERMVSLHRQELPVQIDEYIAEHFTEDIDVPFLCQKFNVGKTRLYEIAKQSYGMGIAEHIRMLRIEKAKKLLTGSSSYTLTEISSLCGFKDYNYFITVFKKVVGLPPKRFSKQ